MAMGFWAIYFSERPPDKSGTMSPSRCCCCGRRNKPEAAAAGLAVLGPSGKEIARNGGRKCFTVDRLADFGEDTARLSFIQTFFGAEAPHLFPLTGDHFSVSKNHD